MGVARCGRIFGFVNILLVALFLVVALNKAEVTAYEYHPTSATTTSPASSEETDGSSGVTPPPSPVNKLLVIMMDGFRWDYYDQSKGELRGFPLFLKEGVQAEWVEPIFPSESYPAWTTISTGLHPENHGILANYMFDLKHGAVFDLDDDSSTSKVLWWQDAEPIWITATRQNKKSFLHLWSRCDVPFQEILPHRCSGYRPAPGIDQFRNTLNLAVDSLLKDYELAMVYSEHLDIVGHEFGPYSAELKQTMRDLDDAMYDFLDRMADTGLDDKVNVIVVSDHGMTWIGGGSGTVYVPVGDYVNSSYVYKVLGKGAMMQIAPYSRRIDTVYENLKGRRGFDVYRRDEIPDEYHFKNHRLVQEILLVAQPNFYLQGLQSSQQVPRSPTYVPFRPQRGTHGYTNMTDMRTIFFARGPDFKKGIVHPPIHLVDEYQLFAKLLHLPAQPNNGTWSKVAGMLVSAARRASSSSPGVTLATLLLVPLLLILHND
ncbi:glycerophosphocholine cholinephosphodiesterase ENPP6 [Folsomia candida]|nr:glycerophosphocholine cholinephosphodiesterase ENPP6 [Folsomia candida]